jgi:hypothetical protein
MKTDELIETLAARPPEPRKSLPHIFAKALALGVCGAILLWLALGPRNLLVSAMSIRFDVKLLSTLSLAVAACGLMLRMARPGAPVGYWLKGLLIAPGVVALAVLAELFFTAPGSWWTRLVGTNALDCLTFIPLLSAAPLIGLLLAMRQAAPTEPGLAGAVCGLSAGGIGGFFYAMHCPDDSPLFLATWYTIAIVGVTIIGGAAGTRLLRW